MHRADAAPDDGHETPPTPAGATPAGRPAPATPPTWDVILSHVEVDAAWARWLTWHLAHAGYRVHPHPRAAAVPPTPADRPPQTGDDPGRRPAHGGDPFLLRHLAHGGDLFLLWSTTYARQSTAAPPPALPGGADTPGGRTVVVRVEDCPRTAPYTGFHAFDLFGLAPDAARDRLLRETAAITPRPRATHTPPPMPTTTASLRPPTATGLRPPATAPAPAAAPPALPSAAGGTLGPAVRIVSLGQERGHPRTVAFSPTRPLLATAGTDTYVHLYELDFPHPPRLAVTLGYGRRINQEWVRAVTFSPDGQILAAVGDAGTTLLWRLPAIPTSTAASPAAGRPAPDGAFIPASGAGPAGRAGPAPLGTLTGHRGYIHDLGFSPGGTLLATAGDDRAVLLWDLADPEAPRRTAILAGHRGPVRAVTFSPDGTLLATGSEDRTVTLWDLAEPTRPEATATIPRTGGPVHTAAFSPDGDLLAVAGRDRHLRLYAVTDPTRPALLAELPAHRRGINAVTFSPDGTLLAAAGADRTLTLHPVTDPDHPGPALRLPAHRGQALDVAFAADSRLLATASADGRTTLWDLFPTAAAPTSPPQ